MTFREIPDTADELIARWSHPSSPPPAPTDREGIFLAWDEIRYLDANQLVALILARVARLRGWTR